MPFHHKQDAIFGSLVRTSENSVMAKFAEFPFPDVGRIMGRYAKIHHGFIAVRHAIRTQGLHRRMSARWRDVNGRWLNRTVCV